MNENKNNSKNNQQKIRNSFPSSSKCDICKNCSKCKCDCSCHFHKRNKDFFHEDIKYKNKYEENSKNNSISEINDTNNNITNYDNSVCENIGTNIQNKNNNLEMNQNMPDIDINLSKNLNDISKYYRNIYTKTKLELDIEKEKTNSLEK